MAIYAIALQIVFTLIMMIISNSDRLSEIEILLYLFYENEIKEYSVLLYPFIPILAIVGAGFVV
ncbi:hypothetical protein [Aneurinibacillus migulanus]|jgi:APA family basic amino acid/polyamine antiporter|uniref:Uncharacterized protein n=1 Tax=Aneurinibacillus migulanus TaxID=47500 RepID=A0A0D1VCF7_ANEMI|nr:hypothetical protein [Aneurinibacillus migulanus]KIV57084.1 hypothetical protein TS65_11370 [Aneurinibacillus migulanus]KON93262.1 hypothetical protein AF333_26785 [Aneurinibacillus migulanus]MED0893043.1 hypothetical protein [Aneurinibacillus migulanus]MED1619288.1 hypothetical protein [Aneurinibacillus migulanus]MED4730493.1 hypothetical protein [Aneurinibacillus migulanus]